MKKLHHMLRAAAGAGVTPPVATDPYFMYNTLLLHGDGTNGAQNNTFIDSSSNAFTITRNGTPTQGSFSPYGDLWSNYFNGTSDLFTLPSNTAFTFGTGDFTFEAWVYHTAASTLEVYMDQTTNGFSFSRSEANKLQLAQAGVAVLLTSASTLAINQWNHIAVTRSGTTGRIFINGVLDASGTVSTNFSPTTTSTIGRLFGSSANYLKGYASNLRIVKGTALYTSNFTPSTTPLTAVSGTSLLTCQSNRFKDNSSNNFAITVTGTPSVQRFSPFEPSAAYSTSVIGGSGYFNGSTDSISTPTSAAVLGTNNWTFECWVYLNAKPSFGQVLGMRKGVATSADGYAPVVIAINSTGFLLYSSSNSTSWDIANGVTFGGTAAVNQWYHVAVVRNGSAIYGYVNGAQTTLVASTSANYTSTNPIFIGGAQASDRVNCYSSNARVVNGTAVYTATFIPPTAPLTAVSGTSLLLNFVNAGIYDNAMMNDLVTVGDAQISTAVTKFGTGSMKFDGTGDYLSVSSNTAFQFGTGNFTVEGWVNFAAVTNCGVFQLGATLFPGVNGIGLGVDNYTPKCWMVYYANGSQASSTTAAVSNDWVHFALVRNSGVLKLYIGGVATSFSVSDTTNYTGTVLGIGGIYSSTYVMNGYLDDVRITKGVARYTANFTPPTAAFPDY